MITIGIAVWISIVMAFPAPAAPPQDDTSESLISQTEYKEIHSEWINFINSGGKNDSYREKLLKRGAPALEVMLDLLYGPRQAEVKDEEIQKLVNQLAPGGKMLVPVGDRWSQTLVETYKDGKGDVKGRSHGGCVFVPLIGEDGW